MPFFCCPSARNGTAAALYMDKKQQN